MYGLEAISANNGWSIAVVGITIVFTGLVLLSFCISRLHRVIEFLEKFPDRKERAAKKKADKAKKKNGGIPAFTGAEKESAKQYRLLARTMADHFSLPRLLHLAEISGLDKPHSRLNMLLEAGIINPDTEGYYTWDLDLYRKIVDRADKDK